MTAGPSPTREEADALETVVVPRDAYWAPTPSAIHQLQKKTAKPAKPRVQPFTMS